MVLMHMIGSGELLDRQTSLYATDSASVTGTRTLFVVASLGSSLGRAFEAEGFVKGVDRDGHVKLDETAHHGDRLFARITPADVRWTCERLARLSAKQWGDAFRAAHYDDATADRLLQRLQEKVRMGLMLGGDVPTTQTARASCP
jgi:hypothetical protein